MRNPCRRESANTPRRGYHSTWVPIPGTATGETMNLHLALTPIVSLIAGILILIVPRLLNFIVAIYLILIGLIGLFPALTA